MREKEVGTLEQLNVTPLARWELIAGKLLPYGLIAFVQVLLVVGFAYVGWMSLREQWPEIGWKMRALSPRLGVAPEAEGSSAG